MPVLSAIFKKLIKDSKGADVTKKLSTALFYSSRGLLTQSAEENWTELYKETDSRGGGFQEENGVQTKDIGCVDTHPQAEEPIQAF